ncbi:hypothetical protein Tco_1191234 [Tanacetum coccineum]
MVWGCLCWGGGDALWLKWGWVRCGCGWRGWRGEWGKGVRTGCGMVGGGGCGWVSGGDDGWGDGWDVGDGVGCGWGWGGGLGMYGGWGRGMKLVVRFVGDCLWVGELECGVGADVVMGDDEVADGVALENEMIVDGGFGGGGRWNGGLLGCGCVIGVWDGMWVGCVVERGWGALGGVGGLRWIGGERVWGVCEGIGSGLGGGGEGVGWGGGGSREVGNGMLGGLCLGYDGNFVGDVGVHGKRVGPFGNWDILDTAYWMEIVLLQNVDQSILYDVSAEVDMAYSSKSANGLDLV